MKIQKIPVVDCNGTTLERGDVLIKCQAPGIRKKSIYIFNTKILKCSCDVLKDGISNCRYTSADVDQVARKYLLIGHSKEFILNYQHTSICWDCNNARMGSVSPCEWTRTLSKTVPGWKAIKSLTDRGDATYNVFECPKFTKFIKGCAFDKRG